MLLQLLDTKSVVIDIDRFNKAMAISLKVLWNRAVWPLMFMDVFRMAYRRRFIIDADSRVLLLAWLCLVEKVPGEFQRGGRLPVRSEQVRPFFQSHKDLEVEPRNRIAGRVCLRYRMVDE